MVRVCVVCAKATRGIKGVCVCACREGQGGIKGGWGVACVLAQVCLGVFVHLGAYWLVQYQYNQYSTSKYKHQYTHSSTSRHKLYYIMF